MPIKDFLGERKRMARQYQLNRRFTGRTTNLALKAIYEAHSNPKVPIKIKDHFGTIQADKMLQDIIRDMLERLELEGFILNRSKLTVTYQGI